MPFGMFWDAKMKNWQVVWHVAMSSLKIGTLSTHWHIKLKNWHNCGTFTCFLAHWHIRIKSLHAFGMLARMAHMACDLANSHILCDSVNVTMKTTISC